MVHGHAGEHLIERGPLARALPLSRGLELVLHQHDDRINAFQLLRDRDAAPRTVLRATSPASLALCRSCASRSRRSASARSARAERIDRADLVPIAALCAEGFGYGQPLIATPKDAVNALEAELGDQVILDAIGRRAVTRKTARRLFDERREAEQRQREVQERNDTQFAELAAVNAPRGSVPASAVPEGVLPVQALTQAVHDAQPRRTSVLEDALSNDGLSFHRIREEDES